MSDTRPSRASRINRKLERQNAVVLEVLSLEQLGDWDLWDEQCRHAVSLERNRPEAIAQAMP
jgi:hypothetical protein